MDSDLSNECEEGIQKQEKVVKYEKEEEEKVAKEKATKISELLREKLKKERRLRKWIEGVNSKS